MASVDQCYNISDLRAEALKRVPKGLFELSTAGPRTRYRCATTARYSSAYG